MTINTSQIQSELLDLFSKNFEKIFQCMLPSQKENLLYFAPTIFNKWYYTSLLEGNAFSPAYLLENNTKDNTAIKTFSLFIDPKKEDISKYQFKPVSYSLQNHPVVDDLKKLIQYCIPDASIEKNGFLSTKQIHCVAKHCSSMDIFYFHYLTTIAYHLKLIIPLPSIYSKRVQASFDYESFFSQSSEQCFCAIFHATIDIAMEKTSTIFDFKKSSFTHEFFLSLLKNSCNLDEILIGIYQLQNIDFEKLWEIPYDQPLSSEEAAFFSSTFYLGILLEKWLFVPLTNYLKLFFSSNLIPYDFKLTLNTLSAILLAKNDPSVELFPPCANYKLGHLGKIFFSEKQTVSSSKEAFNLKEVLAVILKQVQLQEKQHDFKNICTDYTYSNITYLLKITICEDTKFWKIIEVEEEASLMVALCEFRPDFEQIEINEMELSIQFQSVQYQESFQKNVFGVPLKMLALSKEKQIYITLLYEKKSKLKIELLKKSTINDFIIYPRVVEQSTATTEQEKNFDIF